MPVAPQHVTPEHLKARLYGWQDRPGPLYLRLAEALRALAETGAVNTGTRLPSERALAATLNVSRNTVTAAYGQLRDDGWLVGRRGAAARVGANTRTPDGQSAPADPLANLFTTGARPDLDLTIASPSAAPAVLDALARPHVLLPEFATHDAGYYPAGHPILLDAIAGKLRRDGIDADPEEIVVTNGAQQALALVAEALHRPRRPVALEAVTYPGVIDAVRRRGRSQLVALPVDATGLRVDVAARVIQATTPAAVYLTTFQNPTGNALSQAEADVVLSAAEASRTTIVEDRVLADLPLDRQDPPTPLAALNPSTAVVTIGSLSKVFWGGLRIGWIHTNRTLAAHLRTRRRALDLGSPAPMQFLAAWLLEHCSGDTHRWRIRQLQDSLAALTTAISAADLDWRYQQPAGGPNLWIQLPRATAGTYADRAARYAVPVAAGSTFALTADMAGEMIRIPFYRSPNELTTAVSALAVTWRRHLQTDGHSTRPVRRVAEEMPRI
ncbi:PLP-dependent aminotransferase family protein [Saccharopolyspora sp. K220]|uniref:aminotransferase-like domain-containing protein n=1 Tax=Saccharopolyspora soli TaxID=2926618 RepID=UPI001F58211E|nr:PLP-dependent aminotransferase family protein [Saccharopolyspora soli]MCI2419286.1 PLP-dependent aminotransferase family protein [Saccharopolyspora soli]